MTNFRPDPPPEAAPDEPVLAPAVSELLDYLEAEDLELLAERRRFTVYKYVSEYPLLVDTVKKTIGLYNHQVKGRLGNLDKPNYIIVDKTVINGFLLKRSKRVDNAVQSIIDDHIYQHFLTCDQRGRVVCKPYRRHPLLETDSYETAIRFMCEWALTFGNEQMKTSAQPLQYCEEHLKRFTEPPPYLPPIRRKTKEKAR